MAKGFPCSSSQNGYVKSGGLFHYKGESYEMLYFTDGNLATSSLIASIEASVLDMVLPEYYLSIGYKMNLMCFPLSGTPTQLIKLVHKATTYNSCVTIYNVYTVYFL